MAQPEVDLIYNKGQALALMIIELFFIVLMIGFLIYWHYKNPDSRSVTLGYEKELLEKQQENCDEQVQE